MPVFEGLGKALRWLRARQDKRQYAVAQQAGITKAMLSAYETGKQKPSLETLDKVLAAMEADLVDLHDALLVVADPRSRGEAPPAPPARSPRADVPGAEAATAGPGELYRVLGLSSHLPPEEERAFVEMLSGFHRLIRFLHRSVEEGLRRKPGSV